MTLDEAGKGLIGLLAIVGLATLADRMFDGTGALLGMFAGYFLVQRFLRCDDRY
jgi:hypothetical protein